MPSRDPSQWEYAEPSELYRAAAMLDRVAAHENPAPAYSGPTGAALERLQPPPPCPECGADADRPKCLLELGANCPRRSVRRGPLALGHDSDPLPARAELDWHAVIRESLADCSVLLDRAEHDPASMHGVVARLLNAVTTLVDDNKALAERVSALESVR